MSCSAYGAWPLWMLIGPETLNWELSPFRTSESELIFGRASEREAEQRTGVAAGRSGGSGFRNDCLSVNVLAPAVADRTRRRCVMAREAGREQNGDSPWGGAACGAGRARAVHVWRAGNTLTDTPEHPRSCSTCYRGCSPIFSSSETESLLRGRRLSSKPASRIPILCG